jgi:hypothetical protein
MRFQNSIRSTERHSADAGDEGRRRFAEAQPNRSLTHPVSAWRIVGTYADVATEENAVVQAENQVEDTRSSAHTAAAALAFAMGTPGDSNENPVP